MRRRGIRRIRKSPSGKRLDRSVFLHEIRELWPELTPELNKWNGLFHLEMGVVCRFADQLISDKREWHLTKLFAIAERYGTCGNKATINAIDVSFVEDLNFRGDGSSRFWAYKLLPPTLLDYRKRFFGEEFSNSGEYLGLIKR